MEQQELSEEKTLSAQEGTLSAGQLLVSIFTNPGQAFSSLAAKPNWIWPVIIMLVLSLASGFLVQDISIEMTKERIIASDQIPEQSKDQILENFEKNAGSLMSYIQMLIGVLVFVFVPIFFVSAVFLITGNFVLGGSSDYKTMLAVYSWGLMVSIPETLRPSLPTCMQRRSFH